MKEQTMNLRIEMPKPYTPELTEKMMEILGLVREVVDSKWESPALVSVGVENTDRFIRLYDFDTVQPALWKGMMIWASHALPEGTFFIVYKAEPYIFYLPKFLPMFPEEEEEVPPTVYPDGWYLLKKMKEETGFGDNRHITPVKDERVNDGKGVRVIDFLMPPAPPGWTVERMWVLNEEQRGAVKKHVETTLSAINERGTNGIPVGFIKQLHEIKEALG